MLSVRLLCSFIAVSLSVVRVLYIHLDVGGHLAGFSVSISAGVIAYILVSL
jgi:hypothetical protein